jgi:DNA-binding PucR family transcriptional regulator
MVRAGVSDEFRDPQHLQVAIAQAVEAQLRAAEGGVTRFSEIELDALLAGIDGSRFVERHLRPLLETVRESEELINTLRAYLRAGGVVSDAAAALSVHRNTMRYRLAQLSNLLGLDLDDPEVRFRMDLAMRLWEAHYRV